MSDKHNGNGFEARAYMKRLEVVEKNILGLKTTMRENGSTVNHQLSGLKAAMMSLDKKLDRVLTVAVDSATKVNLMQRQNIHAQETCHPMILVQEHLKDHEKADKARDAQQDRIEKRGLSRWQKVGITMGAGTGIFSLLLTLIKLFTGKP